MQEFYSIAQAANYYGVSDATVRNWIRRGTLDAQKVGGRWRIALPSMPQQQAERNAQMDDLITAIWRISHGDNREPMGLGAVGMALVGESLNDTVSAAIREGLREVAEAIREAR